MKRYGADGADPGFAPGRTGKVLQTPSGRRERRLVLSNPPGLEAVRGMGLRGARARDFEDFVAGDRAWTAPLLPLPDPSFREQLRRRLWRIQVMVRGERGLARH